MSVAAAVNRSKMLDYPPLQIFLETITELAVRARSMLCHRQLRLLPGDKQPEARQGACSSQRQTSREKNNAGYGATDLLNLSCALPFRFRYEALLMVVSARRS